VIADVIDNDSWRIWPQGREELMLDKQLYRNLPTVTPADLARVRANYEQVAEIVGTFPQMRPGMVALIADGPENVPLLDAGRARARRGFGCRRAPRRLGRATPGYVLQLVAQLDATFRARSSRRVGSATSALPA
jgi:hypothetical protein